MKTHLRRFTIVSLTIAGALAFIEDDQLVKKILEHLDLWDVKRKQPPRANGPPTESFIIYDESSSPSADDPPSLLLLRRDRLHN